MARLAYYIQKQRDGKGRENKRQPSREIDRPAGRRMRRFNNRKKHTGKMYGDLQQKIKINRENVDGDPKRQHVDAIMDHPTIQQIEYSDRQTSTDPTKRH